MPIRFHLGSLGLVKHAVSVEVVVVYLHPHLFVQRGVLGDGDHGRAIGCVHLDQLCVVVLSDREVL